MRDGQRPQRVLQIHPRISICQKGGLQFQRSSCPVRGHKAGGDTWTSGGGSPVPSTVAAQSSTAVPSLQVTVQPFHCLYGKAAPSLGLSFPNVTPQTNDWDRQWGKQSGASCLLSHPSYQPASETHPHCSPPAASQLRGYLQDMQPKSSRIRLLLWRMA